MNNNTENNNVENTNVEKKKREAPFAYQIPDTIANKKREEYYSKMSVKELTYIITKMAHQPKLLSLIDKIKDYFTGVDNEKDILIAFKVYYEKGGDPDYFTSGAGSSGNCNIM